MNKLSVRAICRVIFVVGSIGLYSSLHAQSPAVEALLAEYQGAGQGIEFDPQAGRSAWFREQDQRSCTSCHGEDLNAIGRHQKTGKVIEPMAPSINPQRLTDIKHMKKWLLRNCKWTYGRECTPQEKGDFLVWLSAQ